MANKTFSLDPTKAKRARTAVYANPKAMAVDSPTKNYKISERTIRSIEDGKKVKLSTAENYATILRCNLNELAGGLSVGEADRVTVDISSTQIFGSCSINLLRDWRSHYTIDDVPPWDDLDIVRGTEREMTKCFKSSTLKPATIDQLFNCAPEYRSTIQSFLQDGSNSHGFGGEKNQVPFIRLDLIWMVQPALNPDEIVIKKLEQVQEELSNANSSLSGQIAHSAESMIQQLKTNSKIKELITSLDNENRLRFLFGEMESECVDSFTKRTLKEGDFTFINIKRKVLMLCHNFVDQALVQYSAWETPKKIDST